MNEDRLEGEVPCSRDVGLLRANALDLGTSVSVGAFLLLGPLIQWNGTIAPLIYLIAGILLLPLAVSLAEQAAASGQGDLIRALESSPISPVGSPWAASLSWVACWREAFCQVSQRAGHDPARLAPAVMLVLTVTSILETRKNRWGQNVMAVMGLATLYARATPDRNTTRRIQSEVTRAIARPGHLELVVIQVSRLPGD